MASRKIFFDPINPKFFTEEEINALSPAECAEACSQLQQNITSCLLRVDTSFVNTHRMIVEQLLPMVEEYGEHCKDIWEGMKFWKTFFEVSAGIRMGGATYQDEGDSTLDTTASSDTLGATPRAGGSTTADHLSEERTANSTFRPEDLFDDEPSVTATLQVEAFKEPTWSTKDVSPYDALQRDIQDALEASKERQVSIDRAKRDHADSLANMLKDLSLESSSNKLPEAPAFNASTLESTPSLVETAIPPPSPFYSESNASSLNPNASAPDSSRNMALLRDLNLGNALSSTPAKPILPRDIPKDWNGLADLRTVPLNSFESPAKTGTKSKGKEKEKGKMSPPRTVSIVPTPARLARTPSKAVARALIQQDILESFGINLNDNIEPPSAMKDGTWQARYGGFNDFASSPARRILGKEADKIFPEPELPDWLDDAFEREEDDEIGNDGDMASARAEGSGTKVIGEEHAFIGGEEDDVFGGGPAREHHPRASDFFDDEASLRRNLEESMEESFENTETSGIIIPLEVAENSFDEDDSGDFNDDHPALVEAIYAQDTEGGTAFFGGQPGEGADFRLMGPGVDDMETYHGGRLLDSRPYFDSPLAAYRKED
ncbi:hypothetical protein BT69DRAFT_1242413 [Atractiella rhizophila]|nr:hypothetical protein BT69DRAFT_1242413 [Atractiella rhizophila]